MALVFAEGLETAEQESEAARKSGAWRASFLRIEDGKTACFRMVSPTTVTIGMHSGIETKPKPEGVKGDWPKRMWGVCPEDKTFRSRNEQGEIVDGFEAGYGDCYVHRTFRGQKDQFDKDKSLARLQTFGVAVLREPVTDPVTGEVVGFKDVTEEFKDADGASHIIPKLVILQQSYSNFWHPLKSSMFMCPKSICGWDFVATRKENDYSFAASGTPDIQPGKDGWKRYEQTLEVTGFKLHDQLTEWASADWYARWLDPDKTPTGGYGRQGGEDGDGEEEASAGAEAAEPVDKGKTDAFREALKASRSA